MTATWNDAQFCKAFANLAASYHKSAAFELRYEDQRKARKIVRYQQAAADCARKAMEYRLAFL